MAEPPGDVLKVDELVGNSGVKALQAPAGVVPCLEMSKHWRYHIDAINAWLKQQPSMNKQARGR